MLHPQWDEETESYLFANGGGNCPERDREERERERDDIRIQIAWTGLQVFAQIKLKHLVSFGIWKSGRL